MTAQLASYYARTCAIDTDKCSTCWGENGDDDASVAHGVLKSVAVEPKVLDQARVPP